MTNTTNDTDAEIAALKAGLDQARAQGPLGSPAMKALRNKRPTGKDRLIRSQMYLSVHDWALRNLLSHILTLHFGRPVAHSLIVRLALRVLAAECQKSLKDPVVAARLKAELVAIRENRHG